MKYFAAVIIAILIFLGGAYFGYRQKQCVCECTVDTVFVPGDTTIIPAPTAVKSYIRKEKLIRKLFVSGQNVNLDTGQVSNPCDSIRVYEYSDSAVTIKDSIQGVLLQQTIIKNPVIQITKTIRKDSLVFQRGFYVGGSAGMNSIRIEAELVNKKGWSYSAGYDIISKSPVIGIKRKIF